MSDAVARVPRRASDAWPASRRMRRSSRRRAGPVAPSAHRPARARRQPAEQRAGRPRPDARSRASSSPSARSRPAARRPRSSPRCRTRRASCSPASDFLELRQRVAGIRALLHAGDHRDAAAVAGEPVRPVQPARRRAADADPHARRADPQSRRSPAPRPRRLREAAQKMADARVRTIIALDADGAPVGMFTLVDLLRRVVLAGRSLDTPLAERDDGAARHAARVGDRRGRRCT